MSFLPNLNFKNILSLFLRFSIIVVIFTSVILINQELVVKNTQAKEIFPQDNRANSESLSSYDSITIPIEDLSYHGYSVGVVNIYDYAPSIMKDTDGKYKIWWCGLDVDRDAILYAESSDGHNWSSPQLVLRASGQHQGVYACDPSVVKASNNMYYLFYTSEHPSHPWQGTDNQIFLAWGADGKNWNYANGGRPVIPLDSLEGSYGIGQSSVLFLNGRFLQFYTDMKNWRIKTYVSESIDGGISFIKLNNGNPILYDATAVDVKYMPSENKYLLVAEGPNAQWKNSYYILNSSFEILVHGEYPGGFLQLPCNHNPGIIGDHVGNILNKNSAWIYFGAGSYGTQSSPCWNPGNWDIHRITLNARTLLKYPLPTNTPTPRPTNTPTPKPTNTPTPRPTATPTPPDVPGDADGNGKVERADYIIWENHYSQSTPNGPSDGDFNQSGRVEGIDYIIWLNNYTG